MAMLRLRVYIKVALAAILLLIIIIYNRDSACVTGTHKSSQDGSDFPYPRTVPQDGKTCRFWISYSKKRRCPLLQMPRFVEEIPEGECVDSCRADTDCLQNETCCANDIAYLGNICTYGEPWPPEPEGWFFK